MLYLFFHNRIKNQNDYEHWKNDYEHKKSDYERKKSDYERRKNDYERKENDYELSENYNDNFNTIVSPPEKIYLPEITRKVSKK